MFKHCKCLFAFVALFVFAVAELTGAEARKILADTEHSDQSCEYALESGADEEIEEEGTLESGGSDDPEAGTAPMGWRTEAPTPIYPGHRAFIRLHYTAAAARAAHTNARLLQRVRPPLFILYCQFSSALPGITA
jgi:hypothetical protein